MWVLPSIARRCAPKSITQLAAPLPLSLWQPVQRLRSTADVDDVINLALIVLAVIVRE